jgi:hypothetical protein
MAAQEPIRCRVVACREAPPDDECWRFYLINDSATSFEAVVLEEVAYSWGDYGNSDIPDASLGDVAAGAHVFAWRDDGDGAELQMDLRFRAVVAYETMCVVAEFPKLYRMGDLPPVPELGRRGFVIAAEAQRCPPRAR